MDSWSTADSSGVSTSSRPRADDDARMEEYISRPARQGKQSERQSEVTYGMPTEKVDWSAGVFHGVPMTNVDGTSASTRYILEDEIVCDEPESSMTLAEMEQLREDWRITDHYTPWTVRG